MTVSGGFDARRSAIAVRPAVPQNLDLAHGGPARVRTPRTEADVAWSAVLKTTVER
jgi:hypothetical protein